MVVIIVQSLDVGNLESQWRGKIAFDEQAFKGTDLRRGQVIVPPPGAREAFLEIIQQRENLQRESRRWVGWIPWFQNSPSVHSGQVGTIFSIRRAHES
jgi:hypothetical protein